MKHKTREELLAELEKTKQRVRELEEEHKKLKEKAGKKGWVVERRNFRNGWLQNERRTYKRKDGTEKERSGYWTFYWYEGGKLNKLYLGKTEYPEGEAMVKLVEQERLREEDESARGRE
jgi:hypothetical protein